MFKTAINLLWVTKTNYFCQVYLNKYKVMGEHMLHVYSSVCSSSMKNVLTIETYRTRVTVTVTPSSLKSRDR